MPLRLIGKVSLSDELTMLERLRGTLVSAREQARLIADSTGDERTMVRLFDVAEDAGHGEVRVQYLIFRAREAQAEAGAEAGCVTLQEDLGRS
jgi:hypothetical protein